VQQMLGGQLRQTLGGDVPPQIAQSRARTPAASINLLAPLQGDRPAEAARRRWMKNEIAQMTFSMLATRYVATTIVLDQRGKAASRRAPT